MKHAGRTIKQNLYGLSRLPRQLSRLRYVRGHGVHSPFVYDIVREVFMHSEFISGDTFYTERLYQTLLEWQVPHHSAVQIANLCAHCDYRDISCGTAERGDMIIVPQAVAPAQFGEYADTARSCGATLAIIAPYLDRERARACRDIVAAHTGTSVDKWGYLLIFNNYLPKQHFKL